MADTDPSPPRRSVARKHVARALWHIAPGKCERQIETLLPAREGFARVQTSYSGISRGTERLVATGSVPQSEWQIMRAPFQAGEFSFPVKYGYSATGTVVEGPDELAGAQVFCLHPHQDQFVVPAQALVRVPAGIPLRRATLAANMETALNAIWDGGAAPGDRIAVIGGGIIGLLTASLAARLPGATVTVVDTNAARSDVVQALGADFAGPETAPAECDVVFHSSATAAGLETAIGCAGLEATIVEMSWYGDQAVNVGLGGAVHSRRLRIVSSQVGHVAPSHRSRWSYQRRLQKAVNLLDAPALDRLVADEIAFEDAAEKLPIVLDKDYLGLPPVIRYPDEIE